MVPKHFFSLLMCPLDISCPTSVYKPTKNSLWSYKPRALTWDFTVCSSIFNIAQSWELQLFNPCSTLIGVLACHDIAVCEKCYHQNLSWYLHRVLPDDFLAFKPILALWFALLYPYLDFLKVLSNNISTVSFWLRHAKVTFSLRSREISKSWIKKRLTCGKSTLIVFMSSAWFKGSASRFYRLVSSKNNKGLSLLIKSELKQLCRETVFIFFCYKYKKNKKNTMIWHMFSRYFLHFFYNIYMYIYEYASTFKFATLKLAEFNIKKLWIPSTNSFCLGLNHCAMLNISDSGINV